jgi:hypothetical protein
LFDHVELIYANTFIKINKIGGMAMKKSFPSPVSSTMNACIDFFGRVFLLGLPE